MLADTTVHIDPAWGGDIKIAAPKQVKKVQQFSFSLSMNKRIILEGDVPSPANPPQGCNFCTRCPRVMDICREQDPVFKDYGDGHFVACWLFEEGHDA